MFDFIGKLLYAFRFKNAAFWVASLGQSKTDVPKLTTTDEWTLADQQLDREDIAYMNGLPDDDSDDRPVTDWSDDPYASGAL